jgi:putative nucleotidyltransferase with HDIG domain
VKQPADLHGIQRNFQDLRALMVGMTSNLAKLGGKDSAVLIRDVSRVMQSLISLEGSVMKQLKSGESQLGALMGIGRTINSSLGLERVLEEVLDSLIGLMHAERGFLMLRGSDGKLEERIARGLYRSNVDKEEHKVSRTIVDKVAATGEAILTTNAQEDPRFENQMSVAAYQLRSILCAPLKNKDELIGVIYVDNRAHAGIFEERDLGLITAFSDQAAVAIDNARLFEELKAANMDLEDTNLKLAAANIELKIAYEATLQGWVRALDMRDKETEGHTQRVTVLTKRLARMLGVSGDELLHITRGALLHDIGKMAIPDSILLKPGSLTDEERELIKKHPVYAYEMLSPIEFLRPAIDIPHYHHEKWDGSGYPVGLSGKEIPFAARIFPVIDVWDALTSDRPYRKGLLPDEVREHIRADSGIHFDPQVVEEFMKMKDMSV